jgi:hypothetical protein
MRPHASTLLSAALCASLATLAVSARTARAQTRAETPDQAADRLFNEARALASAGRYAEACPKLEQSQSLDPGIGTEFDLADCYEHTARPAHAYRLFEEVAKIARASGKAERAAASAARQAALETRVARLNITSKNPVDGLVVSLDGDVVAAADLGRPRPIEAGDHTLEASAPGRTSWRKVVHVDPSAKVDVSLPPLGPIATATPSQPAPSPGPSGQRTVAIVVGAVGIVGLAAGAVAGGLSLASHDSAQHDCPGATCPTSNPGFSTWHQAVVAGNVSTVAFAAGGGLLAGAAVLWLTAPNPNRVTVGLVVQPGEVGLQGRW